MNQSHKFVVGVWVVLTGVLGLWISAGDRFGGYQTPLILWITVTLMAVGLMFVFSGQKRSGRSHARSGRRFYAEREATTIPGLNLAMRPIVPGSFQMGSDTARYDNERPATRVSIIRPFWLGATQVTQTQWKTIMGSNPSHFRSFRRRNCPVETVSWEQAMGFCRRLTEREREEGRLPEGYAYTLPTEAQWEYAARAGTTGDYASTLDSVGWYRENSAARTHQVGRKQANAWGLHDMHGNIFEWCLDWYGKYPGGSTVNHRGPASGNMRIARGGSWHSDADITRSSARFAFEARDTRNVIGFRLALCSIP